jgi:hypothetical protein
MVESSALMPMIVPIHWPRHNCAPVPADVLTCAANITRIGFYIP